MILDSIASRIASVAEANAGPFFKLQVLDEPPTAEAGSDTGSVIMDGCSWAIGNRVLLA